MKYAFLTMACLTLTIGVASAQKKRTETPLPSNSKPVAMTIKTDKATYRPEEAIKFTLKANNIHKETVRLQFSSGQKYDIEIREGKNGKGKRVWLWSEGKMFTQALESLTLAPKAITNYSEKAFAPKEAGAYTAQVTLTTLGRTPRAFGMTTFTVK